MWVHLEPVGNTDDVNVCGDGSPGSLEGKDVSITLCDLIEALDILLITILFKYGVRETSLNIIKTYLTERHQKV